MDFLPIPFLGKSAYAGFWIRLSACLADTFVLLPPALLFVWLSEFDRKLAIGITIPSSILFAMYNVYFNARFGGTLGKLAVGIRVTRPDGSRIGWPEAWKRASVDIAFAFVFLIVEICALTQVDPFR